MYFKEKDKDDIESIETDITTEEKKVEVYGNQTLSGIDDLSNDITGMLKKVAFIYGKTIEFRKDLAKKNNIAKGAITQNDIQSINKIMSHDVDHYMEKMSITANKLRKSYVQLENKVSVILTSNEMDEEYKSIFNKQFFYKNLTIHINKQIQENVDSGVFLIKIDKIEEKNDIFRKNTHKAMLKSIYTELRYLDVVGNLSNNIFAVLVSDVSYDNFEFILKQIIKKTKLDEFEQLVSAGMIARFKSSDAMIRKLEANIEKVKHIQDDFILI